MWSGHYHLRGQICSRHQWSSPLHPALAKEHLLTLGSLFFLCVLGWLLHLLQQFVCFLYLGWKPTNETFELLGRLECRMSWKKMFVIWYLHIFLHILYWQTCCFLPKGAASRLDLEQGTSLSSIKPNWSICTTGPYCPRKVLVTIGEWRVPQRVCSYSPKCI